MMRNSVRNALRDMMRDTRRDARRGVMHKVMATRQIEAVYTAKLAPSRHDEIVALCSAAFEEPFASYLEDVGPGLHLMATVNGVLLSHLLCVPRALHVEGHGTLLTAYIEAVATLPAEQGRGHASALMRAVPAFVDSFELAALSSAQQGFYEQFGWHFWDGPTSVRHLGKETPTPEEQIMILRLPRTPESLDAAAPIACDWRPGEVW